MELSKRALGFLSRQYGIILRQNRLANALGACALSALLCVPTVFMAPENAMADSQNVYTIANGVTNWTSDNNISGDFLITGTSAIEERAGVYAGGTESNAITMSLQSGHTINVTVTAPNPVANLDVYGMDANRTNNTLINAGSITMSVTSLGSGDQQKDTDVYAMFAKGDKNILINSGTISVTATITYEGPNSEPFAYGMVADGETNSKSVLTNDGAINLKATSAYSKAWTRGMYALRNSTITNNGTLNLHSVNTGTESDAEGATAIGLYSMVGSTLVNNGTTTATAQTTNGIARAYGMFISNDVSGTSCTLNNYGTINVAATSTNGVATPTSDSASAYQAYIQGSNSGGATGNIGTWTMKLGERYGKQANGSSYYVFGVGKDATLNFGVGSEGANFIISGAGADFKVGKKYKISDMVQNNGGTVSGFIASVTSSSELLNVELIGTGSYDQQSIKGTATITDDNSPVQAAADHALNGVKGHMSNMSKILGAQRGGSENSADMHSSQTSTATMYADADTIFTDAGGSYVTPESPVWRSFLVPFYSVTSENGGAYDTNMGGLVVGASRPVGNDALFGFHASLAKANSDGDKSTSDALSYALGVNGVYNVDESLYFRGQLTGFYAVNDINMVSGTGVFAQKASADMDTYGMYAELAAGYDIALAPQHVLTPELALSYIFAHMEGFNSQFDSGFGGAPFSMASENYDALYADASLRWTGMYELGTNEKGNNLGTLKPTVKAGVRQALTDPETSSTMNIFGTSATTHADANETSFTCEAGLAWTKDDVTLSATYSGEFGDVEYSHMGMFKVEWEF